MHSPSPLRRRGLGLSLALSFLLAAGLVLAPAGSAAAQTTTGVPPIHILLDGVELPLDSEPFFENDRTLVPFRTISEALGVEVSYDSNLGKVWGRGMGHEVELTWGSRTALLDGRSVALDAAARVVKDRTMIPLRFFSESFGAKVDWHQDTRTITIESPPRRMESLGFYAIRSFGERQYVGRFDKMAYGWARLTREGQVDFSSSEYRWPEAAGDVTGDSLLAEARAAGTERYLMVWAVDGKGDLTNVLADEGRLQQAAADMARAAADRGFDGLVLDLEGLGLTGGPQEIAQVRDRFSRLVRATAQALSAQGGKLIVAVPPPNGAFKGYDLKTIAGAADRIMLMSYEYVSQGPEPVDLVQAGLVQALQEVPRGKLLLGVSADSETTESLLPKVGLAKRYSLAGVAVWRLGLMGDAFMQALEQQIVMK
ncbi:MAG: stalk domain-containing protein [Bacillota bacterium]